MIVNFRHKGLCLFFETGSTRGIRAEHAPRLGRILSFLERATVPEDVDLPGWRLHPLKGTMAGFWSITWITTESEALSWRCLTPPTPAKPCAKMYCPP